MPDRGNKDVAKSAGLAFLGRLGALVEVIGLPIVAALYGSATLGIFFALWSLIRVSTTLTEFAMTTTLQRMVPKAKSRTEQHQILKTALSISITFAAVLATVYFFAADFISTHLNASPDDTIHLDNVIRIYVWVLPFWTLVEVLTSSVRAQRKFGPEIRVRIFYEQGMRLVAAVAFAYLGYETFGLFMAHVVSTLAAALLALRLASRFYSLKHLIRAPYSGEITREMLGFAVLMAPANLIKRLNSELPVLMLNLILPGTAGANAAAFYGLGRRIASVLQVVRQSFEYVVAPFASFNKAHRGHEHLTEMFAFATRMIMVFILPFGIFLLTLRDDLLAVAFSPEFGAAASVLMVLALGRLMEALSGPAEAMVEMLGHRTVPLMNGLAGIAVMTTLIYFLAPSMGAMGAAIGAAVGLNVTAYLSLLETIFAFKIVPYRKSLVRPVLITLIAAGSMAALLHNAVFLDSGLRLILAIPAILLTLSIMMRWGLYEQDIHALGRVGKLFSPKKARGE